MPLPKRGMTNVSRSVAFALDLVAITDAAVSTGLEKVHRGLPNVGSQAGLILVISARIDSSYQLFSSDPQPGAGPINLTFEPNFVRVLEFLINDKLGWRRVKHARAGVNKQILFNPKDPVRHPTRRANFSIRQVGCLVDEIFADGYLVDKCRRQELAQDLELIQLRG